MALFQHGGHVGVVVLLLVLDDDAGGPLEGQGVDGDVLRVEGDGLTQTLLEPFHRVAGQASDEVHVDVVVACGPGLGIAVEDVLGRVLAANVRQYFIREGLRIDGDAGRAVFPDDGQLFGVGAVGASGFHRVFHDGGKVEAVPHRPHELAQLRCRGGWGGCRRRCRCCRASARPCRPRPGWPRPLCTGSLHRAAPACGHGRGCS